MKTSLTILFSITCLYVYSQGCTISTSNLIELSGDDGSGNCTYSLDILFTEGSGPDNGTLTFTTANATLLTGGGPHSCACTGNTYTITFEAACGTTISITANHDNSGNGNDCTITAVGIVLPVEWLEFNLKKGPDREVILDWSTLQEVNNDYFEVEVSKNGTQFEHIGSIKGSGTSNILNSYRYIHMNPLEGTSYYRIKQVDYDGLFSYSEIREYQNQKSHKLKAYPNPASNVIYISKDPKSIVHIYNSLGEKIISTLESELSTLEFKNGYYFLFEESTNGTKAYTFIVAH